MTTVTVTIGEEVPWPDLKGQPVIVLDHGGPPIQIAIFEGGMMSGLPSVGIRLDLPDGKTVIGETSARMFCTAGQIIAARYPTLFEGPS